MKFRTTLKLLPVIFISIGVIFSLVAFLNLISNFAIKDFYIQPALSANIQLSVNNQLLNNKPEVVSVIDSPAVNNLIGIPIRLKIPEIKLNVSLEQVGLTARGAVDVPKGKLNAAWFNLWPRPGEVGNAIIVGHYGTFKNGLKAVFNNLDKLKVGDKIYVEDNLGRVTTFVVRKFQVYNATDIATDVFISEDNQAHLNLITCGGIWDKVSKSYSKRLVIFADRK